MQNRDSSVQNSSLASYMAPFHLMNSWRYAYDALYVILILDTVYYNRIRWPHVDWPNKRSQPQWGKNRTVAEAWDRQQFSMIATYLLIVLKALN